MLHGLIALRLKTIKQNIFYLQTTKQTIYFPTELTEMDTYLIPQTDYSPWPTQK